MSAQAQNREDLLSALKKTAGERKLSRMEGKSAVLEFRLC